MSRKREPRVRITGAGIVEGGLTIIGYGATGTIRQPIDMEVVCNGTVLEHHETLVWDIRILKEGEV